MLYCVLSCHVVLCRVASYRVVPYHVASYRTAPRHIVLCHVMLCRTISYRVVSCRMVSCCVVLCRMVSSRVMLYCIWHNRGIMSYFVISYLPCRVVSYRVVLSSCSDLPILAVTNLTKSDTFCVLRTWWIHEINPKDLAIWSARLTRLTKRCRRTKGSQGRSAQSRKERCGADRLKFKREQLNDKRVLEHQVIKWGRKLTGQGKTNEEDQKKRIKSVRREREC